jgi:hypothetical protein
MPAYKVKLLEFAAYKMALSHSLHTILDALYTHAVAVGLEIGLYSVAWHCASSMHRIRAHSHWAQPPLLHTKAFFHYQVFLSMRWITHYITKTGQRSAKHQR